METGRSFGQNIELSLAKRWFFCYNKERKENKSLVMLFFSPVCVLGVRAWHKVLEKPERGATLC